MAQVLFAGGKLHSVTPVGSTSDSTVSGSFDPTYCDGSILSGSLTTDGWDVTLRDASGAATTVTTGQTFWGHAAIFVNSSVTNGALFFYVVDSSGFPWFAIRAASTSTYGIYYNSGTGASPVWTQVGTSTFSIAGDTLTDVDMKVTIGSPHVVEVSINRTAVANGSFVQAGFTNIAKYCGRNQRNTWWTHFSQILCTEGIPTINAKVKYCSATAAGASSGWTGAYTDINEVVGNDATVLSAATAGLKSTFPMTDVTVPTGYTIKDIFVFMRAKNDGVAPTNIKPVVRSGGTDYVGSNLSGIGTSFAPLVARYAVDPATSVAWTQAGWNAVELGVESAA